ncbi:hypothetical protein ACKKBG_A23390 [Auxenochlorella protothecoides x Auxenochlorella symbiontica]
MLRRATAAAVLATGVAAGVSYYKYSTTGRLWGGAWGPEEIPGLEEVPASAPAHPPPPQPSGRAPAHLHPPTRTYPSPHLLAASNPEAVRALRSNSPSPTAAGGRFTDAELMRYAVAAGWLAAAPGSPAAAKCLAAAAAAARRTDAWLASAVWATPAQLVQAAHLAHWAPPGDEGPGARPVLVLRVGAASHEARGRAAAAAYGDVIVTLVQGAVMEGRLADVPGEGRPQDLVVRVDAGGASVLSSTRILPVVRYVATTLNQHFPGRLYVMELHNLPPFATWLVVAVRGLMHATTRDKVVVVGEGGRRAAPPP